MKNSLRPVECPANIIDQIGEWSGKEVGETYGRDDGYIFH